MVNDPWASGADTSTPVAGDDEFDVARSDYLTVSHLDGRLVLIWALESRWENGSTGKYEKIISDVVVLDGTPGEDEVALGYEQTPYVAERMHISNGAIVDKLKSRIGNPRPYLGRLTSAPSKANRSVLAFWVGEPTDADKATASQYLRTPGSYRPRPAYDA